MEDNKLCECDHCGVLRVYEAGKSCPGCGAPLTPGEKHEVKSEPDTTNYSQIFGQAAMEAQRLAQHQQAAMGMMQSSQYDRMLGMQQSMMNQKLAMMFGMGQARPERRGKK